MKVLKFNHSFFIICTLQCNCFQIGINALFVQKTTHLYIILHISIKCKNVLKKIQKKFSALFLIFMCILSKSILYMIDFNHLPTIVVYFYYVESNICILAF